jgi:hypothetical protein
VEKTWQKHFSVQLGEKANKIENLFECNFLANFHLGILFNWLNESKCEQTASLSGNWLWP